MWRIRLKRVWSNVPNVHTKCTCWDATSDLGNNINTVCAWSTFVVPWCNLSGVWCAGLDWRSGQQLCGKWSVGNSAPDVGRFRVDSQLVNMCIWHQRKMCAMDAIINIWSAGHWWLALWLYERVCALILLKGCNANLMNGFQLITWNIWDLTQ